MTQHTNSSNRRLDRVMSLEQFEQVVTAILDGKYSWACVLILRFAGYNPLHYIPYRTYNRLVKENSEDSGVSKHQTDSIITDKKYPNTSSDSSFYQSSSSRNFEHDYLEMFGEQGTSNLNYLETKGQQQTQIDGNTLEKGLRNETEMHNIKMQCPYCASLQVRKNGHRQSKQNYFCCNCKRQFIEFYSLKGYSNEIKEKCLKMYFDGISFREIERVSGVHHTTVIQWVKQVTNSLPKNTEICEDFGDSAII